MDYGLCLPNFPDGASPEGIEAGRRRRERLGLVDLWTTDHVLVRARGVGRLRPDLRCDPDARLGRRAIPAIRLGTSVIVVPQRNAVVLAKELASLNSLTGGRVTAGVGIGWNRAEFANLGCRTGSMSGAPTSTRRSRLWRHSGRARLSRSTGGSTR